MNRGARKLNRNYKKSGVNTKIGLVEWFRPGEYERVGLVLADLQTLGVSELRTGISWTDWYSSQGDGWYAWLLPRLAQQVRVLPCMLYTPPCLGVVPKTSAPPQKPKAYADFIDVMITRFGAYFDWIELWNEPNNLSEWDWRLDPGWQIFSEMIGGAAYWARSRGKKTVLAAPYPAGPEWLRLMLERGVMAYIDAVGVHGFPSTAEHVWQGCPSLIRDVKRAIAERGSKAKVWITETGFSTRRREESAQLRAFVEAAEADVERLYYWLMESRGCSSPRTMTAGGPYEVFTA